MAPNAPQFPRLIFVRHGQTEWLKLGQHTLVTDIPLTLFGVAQMRATGKVLIGNEPQNLICAAQLRLVITLPRTRAKQTFQLLSEGVPESERTWTQEVAEDIREWEYGLYEGMLLKDINTKREAEGLPVPWDIWSMGCVDGEDADDVTKRVDAFIARVREVHRQALEEKTAGDVLVVAHGHILRCLAARWLGFPIHCNPKFMLDAGGIGVLLYQHKSLDEPALMLAGALVIPVDEQDHRM